MKKKHKHVCNYCGKERERCRIVSVKEVLDRPEVEWCCPSCWEKENMDAYLYEKEGLVR